MVVSAPDIHGSCLLGDFPSIGPQSEPGPAFTPRPPPATHPHLPLETYIFPRGRARGMHARCGASWAESPRAAVVRRRPAASPLPAVPVRRAAPPETERRARPRVRGRALVGRLHESPLGLGTSGCWECVLPRGGGRDGGRMDDGILSIPRLSLAPFRPHRLVMRAEEPQPVALHEVGGCCPRASK